MLNDRIEYNNKFGSIRYIGPVDNSDHIWYGVEWDDSTLGKHDGTYKGIKYFKTKYKNGGSFVKPDSCKKSQVFFDAILDKYCISDADMKEEIKLASKKTNVQYKTKENTIRLKNLISASTPNKQIKSLGEANLVLTNCPNIMEVDLSNNLIAHWSDVAQIAYEIPNLVKLILNGNRLILNIKNINNSIDFEADMKYDCFKNVMILSLKAMDLNWNDVNNILSRCGFINCHELYLYGNQITNISNVDSFMNVQHIDLENNRLDSWDEILKLSDLPYLKTLQLNNCGLTNVYFTDVHYIDVNFEIIDSNKMRNVINSNFSIKTSMFKKLENLYLADNKIEKMKNVDELDRLYNLKNIRLSRNPILLLFPNETSFRSEVIARIGGITSLNGGKISAYERRGSEIDFVNSCTQRWLLFLEIWKKDNKTENPHYEFSISFPRFFHLVAKYKVNLEEEIMSKHEVTNLKSNLISLNILFLKNESLTKNWEVRFTNILNDFCLATSNDNNKDENNVTMNVVKDNPNFDNEFSKKNDIPNNAFNEKTGMFIGDTSKEYPILKKNVPKNLIVARLKGVVRKIFKDIQISKIIRVVKEDLILGKNSIRNGSGDKFGFVVLDLESKSIDCYGVENDDVIIVC